MRTAANPAYVAATNTTPPPPPVYTLFGQTGGGAIDSYTNSLVLGVQFSVSPACHLTGIWFYSASGATQLPAEIGVWDATTALVPGTDVPSPSWSGTAGSGWVKHTYGSPPALAAASYQAGAWNGAAGGAQWYSNTAGYWSGGITNGLISCPNQPDNYFDSASAFSYPATAFGNFNIWLDVEVSA